MHFTFHKRIDNYEIAYKTCLSYGCNTILMRYPIPFCFKYKGTVKKNKIKKKIDKQKTPYKNIPLATASAQRVLHVERVSTFQ